MLTLVLLRHGESIWNEENRFTGWTDVDLSARGIEEAHLAGKQLKNEGFEFDFAYTSVLTRAIRTLWIALDELNLMWIPVERSWRLNERHYGALQELNKTKTVEKHGQKQVYLWRRSFTVSPPALSLDDPRHPRFDSRYAGLAPEQLPATESLKDTFNRVMPYWHQTIEPRLRKGERILISAHGNSLRALVKYLDGISDAEIDKLNIPTSIPLVYELDRNLMVISHRYLANSETVQKAVQGVVNQI
jgi:2,3-bisphosphoglycerate-dependent phosphoglycerate mutase